MAIDNRLQVFNEEGQSVDYDILASDVKFLPDGKDLPTKLAEMEQEIEEAGGGDGTVTGVKVGSTTYEPTEGVVDLSTPFNDKVDKDPNKELIPSTDLAKLQNLPTATELTTQLGQKANDNAVVKSISVNGQNPQTPTNGNVNLQVQAGEQVSVIQPDPANGTFTIRVGSTDYTINLNHSHEGMVKLEKFVASNPPASMTNDKIYVQVNNLTTPTEIEALYIFGLEFTGGGVPDTGEPVIKTPANGSTINLGTFDDLQSTPTKTITVWGKYLINGLTLEVTANSGFSLSKSTLTKNEALAGEPVTISFDPSVLTTTTTTTTEAALAIKDSVTNEILSVCTVSVTFIDESITLNKAIAIDGNSYQVVNPSGFCTIKVAVAAGHTYKLHYGFVANQTDEDFIALGYDANNSPVYAARYRYSYNGNTNKYRTAAIGTSSAATTLEVTMKTSALDECYIYDTNSHEYLFQGTNADQSLDT